MSVPQSIGPSRLLEYVKSTSDYDEDDNGNVLAIAVAKSLNTFDDTCYDMDVDSSNSDGISPAGKEQNEGYHQLRHIESNPMASDNSDSGSEDPKASDGRSTDGDSDETGTTQSSGPGDSNTSTKRHHSSSRSDGLENTDDDGQSDGNSTDRNSDETGTTQSSTKRHHSSSRSDGLENTDDDGQSDGHSTDRDSDVMDTDRDSDEMDTTQSSGTGDAKVLSKRRRSSSPVPQILGSKENPIDVDFVASLFEPIVTREYVSSFILPFCLC
jgi:hypothetical protein